MPTAGPLWPGGPAETPCQVELVGAQYTVGARSGLRLAFAAARGINMVPDLLLPDDRDAVYRRLADPVDLLDWCHLERATVYLTAQLAGIDTGVNGWRAALRLCHALVQEWPRSAGLVMRAGVQVRAAPLWELCAAMYVQCIDNPDAKDSDVKRAKLELFAPFEGEPVWMRDAKPPPPIAAGQARAGAMELFAKANAGMAPKIPKRCDDCGRMQGHDRGCAYREESVAQGVQRCRLCGRAGEHAVGCPGAGGAAVRAGRRGLPRRGETGYRAPQV